MTAPAYPALRTAGRFLTGAAIFFTVMAVGIGVWAQMDSDPITEVPAIYGVGAGGQALAAAVLWFARWLHYRAMGWYATEQATRRPRR